MNPIYIILLTSAVFTFGYQTRVWLEVMRKHENDPDMQSGISHLKRIKPTAKDLKQARSNYRNGSVLVLLILLSTCASAQYMHADVGVGFTTRFRGMLTTSATYQAPSGFEASITATGERRHHVSLGGTVGLRAYTTSDWRADGIVFFAGAAYSFHSKAALTELRNQVQPIIGAKFMSSFGFWEVRYTGNTFACVFGHRLFNNNK